MFGDGAAGMLGAQQIVQHMTRQFYMQGGAANIASTSGLNRDQIGGIMMLAEMDLRQGERANAAARLAYAAQWGGTTAAGAEARALLAQYFAPAAAPQPPAADENV